MKKIITILIIAISIIGYSQNDQLKKSIELSDFEKENDRVKFKEKTFYFKNGSNEYVPVVTSVFMTEIMFQSISIEKINEMILLSNDKIQYQVKNKYTYMPRSVRLDHSYEQNQWTVLLDYSAQNDYGATKGSFCIVHFNNDGTFKDIVTY